MSTRKYSDTDEIMLIKAKVIIRNSIEDEAALKVVQPSFDLGYFSSLDVKVDNALANFVGMDKTVDLRSATSEVESLIELAFTNLRIVKTLFEINFKNEQGELLNHYGYNSYYTETSKRKQDATISILSVVARDADKLKEKFTNKGLPTTQIDEIIKLSTELPKAEAKQEQLKSASKPVTEEQLNVLNGIYTNIMDICKLARVIFADDEVKRNRYIYKYLGNKRNSKNKKENNDENSNTESEPTKD